MGIGLVLIFWAVVGFVLAFAGMLALGATTAFITRGATKGRRPLIIAACLFPYGCLVWTAAVFIFQACINGVFLHRDPGLGDGWECPLSNGYQISMIDVTDHGTVYNPKTQKFGGINGQDDAVSGVRSLQVAGRYIFGGKDGQSVSNVESYFELDTTTGKSTKYFTKENVEEAAQKLGIKLRLEPINDVYAQNRYTWFDGFAVFLLFVPPCVVFWILCWQVWRIRNSESVVSVSAAI